jgi:hypothetical protein
MNKTITKDETMLQAHQLWELGLILMELKPLFEEWVND